MDITVVVGDQEVVNTVSGSDINVTSEQRDLQVVLGGDTIEVTLSDIDINVTVEGGAQDCVPYNGAKQNVRLGENDLQARNVCLTGDLLLKQGQSIYFDS